MHNCFGIQKASTVREMELASLCGLIYFPERTVHVDYFIRSKGESMRDTEFSSVLEFRVSMWTCLLFRKDYAFRWLRIFQETNGRWNIEQSQDGIGLSMDLSTILERTVHFDSWRYCLCVVVRVVRAEELFTSAHREKVDVARSFQGKRSIKTNQGSCSMRKVRSRGWERYLNVLINQLCKIAKIR